MDQIDQAIYFYNKILKASKWDPNGFLQKFSGDEAMRPFVSLFICFGHESPYLILFKDEGRGFHPRIQGGG